MRLRLLSAVPGWQSLLVSTLLLSVSYAKKDTPRVSSTAFANSPYDLEYFDDSDVILMQNYGEDAIYRSENAGESWNKVEDVPAKRAQTLIMHPFDHRRAYVMTQLGKHWKTINRGLTWQVFDTIVTPDPDFMGPLLRFHAGNADKVIFNGMDCAFGMFCESVAVYTTDNFNTQAKLLRAEAQECNWAKATELFATKEKDVDDNRILCIAKGQYSRRRKDYRLLISDNFFQEEGGVIQEFEPDLEESRRVTGVARMAAVKNYILAASMSEKSDEMALYVTSDTKKWHRAIFPHDHKLVEEAYTLLESTNYSIQIDVLTTKPSNPMGVLLSSNSNGTYFTRNLEHTNRNYMGNVDFEKVAGIQGIALVNVVDNWEDVEKSSKAVKKVKSQISFDDGRTWEGLKAGKEQLHITSITSATNTGRVFSSLAPGLLMGIGNTGDHLKNYQEGDLYVSDTAGHTWIKALGGPHKYEFGDSGSILLAVEDVKDKLVDKLSYSLNHGKDWKEIPLEQKILPYILTTTLDSTSLKFLLLGSAKADKEKTEYFLISIDFEDLNERKCQDKDFEKWYARVDDDGNPTCLMGHKQFYTRRKADAECFVRRNFVDPVPEFEKCDCTDADYECDYNFVRSEDRKSCILADGAPPLIPAGACKNPDDTFMGSSGWRLIPGDECIPPKEGKKDDLVQTKCGGKSTPPASGKVKTKISKIDGMAVHDRLYLERTESSSGDDETVIAQTSKGLYISHDGGKEWKEILHGKKIKYIIRHTYINDRVFFIADDQHVFYSLDRGYHIQEFEDKVPHPANWKKFGAPMRFHPIKSDWIIWTGGSGSGDDAHAVASYSDDRGDHWKTLKRYVKKCEFIFEDQTLKKDSQLIYCKVRSKESPDKLNNPWQLVSSSDFFDTSETHFTDVVDFATQSEYIVVAIENKDELAVQASIDGKIFAPAEFPSNFQIPHQNGYTVLDSSTHAIFLHVTVDKTKEAEYGGIIKSNSNGTSYVLSVSQVNRDKEGYVDFEKMFGVEGVALVNVVQNYDKAAKEGKKLKTKITHNDGAVWRFITPPSKDVEGNNIDCTGSLEKCSLNIHGYTERFDKSKTYSSASAVGLMIGVGNTGEYLAPYKDSHTYVTTDAGITWRMIKKGTYLWEYGDQGSLIVLVNDREDTNIVSYSRDEGKTWTDHEFSDKKVRVFDITTLPSDNSRNFLLWAKAKDDEGSIEMINLDFTGLTDRQCKLDEKTGENEDYYLWSPSHPSQDTDCLFGHVSQYHRKKPEADCYNGRIIQHLHNVARNCTCTRQDFECDYNFEALNGGECVLVAGLEPLDNIQQCRADPSLIEYYEPTGYRKIPLSTCEGGKEMQYTSPVHPCPGKEDEFWKKRGLSGIAIFFIVLISLACAGAGGYWMWRNWQGHFGQIRLGEQPMFHEEAPHIKYPVMVISAVVAVIIALPVLASTAWNGLMKLFNRGRGARFTTRGSFARDADYTAVDDDEGELLGDESDEEV